MFTLPRHVVEQFALMHTHTIQPDAPVIAPAVDAYRQRFGIPATARPTAFNWRAVYANGKCVLVIGDRLVGAGVLEITDMYPAPDAGRLGTVAIYGALTAYSLALDVGTYRTLMCACLYENDSFRRAVERVFNVQPRTVIYSKDAPCVSP